MEHDKDRKATETWEEVFTALDATNVNDGFVVERDVRTADERPALDAFFAAKSVSGEEEASDLAD